MRAWLGAVLCLVLLCGFSWEGRIVRLRRQLHASDPQQRAQAVQLLSDYAPQRVGDAIVEALSDPSAVVRQQAARVAGRLHLQKAVPRLVEWLDDPDAPTRTAAAEALGRLQAQAAVPGLIRALGDSEPRVRRGATEALGAIGTPPTVVPLLGRLDDSSAPVRAEAATALGAMGDRRAVIPLVGTATDDAPSVRAAVYRALGQLGDPRATSVLRQGVYERDPSVQLPAIAALALAAESSAVPTLQALLSEPDSRAREAALTALSTIGDASSVRVLVEALQDHKLRAPAARALESIFQRRASAIDATAVLTDALQYAQEPKQAGLYAEVIAHLPPAPWPDALTEVVADRLQRKQIPVDAALAALGNAGSSEALLPILTELTTSKGNLRPAALAAVHKHFERHPEDGRAADPLLNALKIATAEQRAQIARLLGSTGAARAASALAKLAASRKRPVRLAAIRSLGQVGTPNEAAPLLRIVIWSEDAATRFAAGQALGRVASTAALPSVLTELDRKAPRDRHALLVAMGELLGKVSPAKPLPEPLRRSLFASLAKLARGPDRHLSSRAIGSLGRWSEPAATRLLVTLAQHVRPATRRDAAWTLASGAGAARLPALRRLAAVAAHRPLDDLHAPVMIGLGEAGTSEDIARVLQLAGAGTWPASAAAAFALQRMGRRGLLDKEAHGEALCALAAKQGPAVRANAALALGWAGVARCNDGAHPARWMRASMRQMVRVAAVGWAQLLARAKGSRSLVQTLCSRPRVDPVVMEACRRQQMPPLDGAADAYAYGPSGKELLAGKWVALRMSDGSVLVTRADANGHIRFERAPKGKVWLSDPF